MNAIKVVGIDLGKDVCSVVAADDAGNVLLRRRMRRVSILKLAAGMPVGEMAISSRMRVLIEDMRDEWRALDARIATFDAEFANLARTDASMKLLSTIPGIGPLNATAFVASIGKAETFGRGRDLAAWLGLVPR